MTDELSINPTEETDRITAFITNIFSQASKKTAIVAVSGGIDSATSLLLTIKALGPENVLALHMPAKLSQPVHTQHTNLLLDVAHIPPQNRLIIPIHAILQKSWRIIKHFTTDQSRRDELLTTQENPPEQSSRRRVRVESKAIPERYINQLRLANLSARIRMLLLYDQAKKHDALVVGTENKSEHILGYFTRFGDEASDLEPIRHLYKTQVIELSRYLEVPQPIIDKPPSADLWRGQTDTQELGFSYEEADPILNLYNQGKTVKEITALGLDIALVKKVMQQINHTKFKHEVPYTLDN